MSNIQVSEEELFAIEEAYEESFKQILIRDGIANTFKSREGSQMATPCVEVKFLPGQVTEGYRHAMQDPAIPSAYAGWKGSQLIFTIKTQRQNNASQHKIYLAKIRKNCQYYNLLNTWPATFGARANAFPDIREMGQTHAEDSDNDFDITVMTFWMMHNLKESAWPLNI